MKNSILVWGYMGVLLTCNAAEKNKNISANVFIKVSSIKEHLIKEENTEETKLNNYHYGKNLFSTKKNSFPTLKSAKDTLIIMNIVPDLMKYSTDLIEVKAGQEVVLELENLDGMQHNMLIIKPGTLEKVGAAADALARDPKAAQKNYVPDDPNVLYATKLLDPNDIATLTFTAPSEPGDYPFVCTFPGHWRMMNGIMRVTK